ncbi:MAG: DNA cytosine methyltransferase [Candidatus Melainabacteria bacterium HGW-Melainabacteria-1]|nr:MAG: DNA cytosine methyltransferase [Candidatus Melainabacteria bacterium HGW-Melainabacteria-1]
MDEALDRRWEDRLSLLRGGEQVRVLDLFSGCGGLSLGFRAAGQATPGEKGTAGRVKIIGGVEIDRDAAATHGANFHPGDPRHAIDRDLTRLEPEQLLEETGQAGLPVDILVGGPPCQAFSRIGRAKLREIAKHPLAHLEDDRSSLYLRYLHWVDRLRPLALVMENVPEMMCHGGVNYASLACEALEQMGYDCGYTLLNAVHYGVPQMRSRVFLIAWARVLKRPVDFPTPVVRHILPAGYQDASRAATRLAREEACRFLKQTPSVQQLRKSALTARQALQDLPVIGWHLELISQATEKLSGRLRPETALKPGEMVEYSSLPVGKYAKLMRNWPGLPMPWTTDWHTMRWLPRDYPIFALMEPGDQYPQALELARQMFADRILDLEDKGHMLFPGDAEYIKLHEDIIPPYDEHKFPNKWRKMEADSPARTLMAHLGKDSYSHIHYDSAQARTITVREAARLQSFPDGFSFCGSMNAAFRQIGNAVPPLLAWHLGSHLLEQMGVAPGRAEQGTGSRKADTSEKTARLPIRPDLLKTPAQA